MDDNGNNYSYDPDVSNDKSFLGKGQFGVVFKGNRLSPKVDGWVLTEPVAVKSIDLKLFEEKSGSGEWTMNLVKKQTNRET